MTGAVFSATSPAWMHLTRWSSKMGAWFIVQDDCARYKRGHVVFTSRGAIGSVLFGGRVLFGGAFYLRGAF